MGLFTNKSNSAVATPQTTSSSPKSQEAAASVSTRGPSLAPPPAPAPVPQQSERSVYLQQLKVRIHQQLVSRLDVQNLRMLPPETVRGEVRILIRELCQSEKGLINSADQ